MSKVIYARVSDSLHEAVSDYAEDAAVTLTRATADLLERGLGAASDETSVATLEARAATVGAEKAEVETRLVAAESELMSLRSVVRRSTSTVVGRCPNEACQRPISGYDLLATGICANCNQALSDLLAPKSSATTGLDQREIGLLLGALGIALIAVGVSGMAKG